MKKIKVRAKDVILLISLIIILVLLLKIDNMHDYSYFHGIFQSATDLNNIYNFEARDEEYFYISKNNSKVDEGLVTEVGEQTYLCQGEIDDYLVTVIDNNFHLLIDGKVYEFSKRVRVPSNI